MTGGGFLKGARRFSIFLAYNGRMDNPDRVTYFAATDTRGKRVPVRHQAEGPREAPVRHREDRHGQVHAPREHGHTGHTNGEGLAFVDPHGGTVDKLLDYIPESRLKDVVYFAPFDMEHPVAFNVMEDVGYDKRHLVVSGLMAAFKKIWVDAWSARMEYILSNTLLALLEYPDSTLLSVNRMYVDKAFRKKVVENVKDPVVKDFWTKEFATYTDRYTQEATPAIQNKIGQFTSNPLIRNIIGQPRSSFDIRTMMDEKKILIINLSKGLVGDTNTQLLGSMLTTRIFLAAISRADASASELSRLPNFYFYVDEFQNFANETFAEILSEARKYKLNLTIAHQYVEQMEEEVRDAVFGNVGTTVCFRVGPFDAEVLETIFTPEFTQEDLVNLGFAQIYLTLMIDGIGSRPFSATTIPPIEPPKKSFRKEVLEASRSAFGAPREKIEKDIMEELSIGSEEPQPSAPKRSEYAGNRSDASRPKGKPVGNGSPNPNTNHGQNPHREHKPKVPPPPPSAAVGPADLKAAIAAITKKADDQGAKKAEEKHEALAGVLKEVAPVQKAEPRQELPRQAPPAPTGPSSNRPAFEVPEADLKAVFEERL